MAKVVTFGEIMLRLSSPLNSRIVQSKSFDVNYGGGEANVALSLANYGHEALFVTKLPDNLLGQSALNALREYGVDTSYIVRGGERLGIYYLETGASMRPSTVIYDRKHSAIYDAVEDDFDFDVIFEGKDWFHFTGITPALNPKVAKIVEKACIAAKKAGCTVSCDLNFRKKLWTSEEAIATMSKLMKYVDVCIGNEEDADKCLGFKPEATDVTKGVLNLGAYESIFKQMKAKFGFKFIATSLRESISASDNNWSGLLYDGTKFYSSKKYAVRIVDRVGAGDSFAAGIIHGLLTYKDPQQAVEFAVAASALKHTIPGDFNLVSKSEVETLMGGDGSGRVQR